MSPRTHRALLPSFRRLLILLMIVLVGCTSARRRADQQTAVLRNLRFEGNGGPLSGNNDLQLAQQLETEDSAWGLLTFPFMYLVEPKLADDTVLPRDAYRLEVWYAHHGWFDAEVEGWELRRVRDRGKRRAPVVDLVGHVNPGPRSSVSEYVIEGMDGPLLKVLLGTFKHEAYLRQGDPFDLEYAEHDRNALAQLLQNHGFAYAQVDLAIRADPADTSVVVELTATPGIPAAFGTVNIRGNRRIPDHFIAEALTFEEGDGYKSSHLLGSQRALFEMGTFSLARVEPDLSDPTNPNVPVTVRLTETKWRTFRLGIGSDAAIEENLGDGRELVYEIDVPDADVQYSFPASNERPLLEGITFSPRVTGTYRHTNLFRQLIRLETAASLGYSYTFGTNIPQTVLRPQYSLRGTINYPRVFHRSLALELEGTAVEDTVDGLDFRRLVADFTGIVKPTSKLQLRAGPHFEEYCFLLDGTSVVENRGSCPDATGPDANSARIMNELFGVDFENPFLVTAMDERLIYDGRVRDDDASPVTRGRYMSVGMRQALPIHNKSATFLGFDVDGRLWAPLRLKDRSQYSLRLAWAGRAAMQVPILGDEIPYPEKTFLGGSTSIRGFRTRQVGPYRSACADDECTALYFQPQGGTLALQTTLELRYPWAYGITWATFADVGTLSDGVDGLAADPLGHLRYSAGVGLRYDTVVGPVRFDVSLRPRFTEDFGPVEPLDGVENAARSYDLFSSLYPGEKVRPPFALVYYLAIGEAL